MPGSSAWEGTPAVGFKFTALAPRGALCWTLSEGPSMGAVPLCRAVTLQHSLSLPGGNVRTLTGLRQNLQLKVGKVYQSTRKCPYYQLARLACNQPTGRCPLKTTDLQYIQHRSLTRHAEMDAEVIEYTSMAASMPRNMRSDCLAYLRLHAGRHGVLVIRMLLQVCKAA